MKLYSPKKNLQKVFTILVFVLLLQNNGWGQASLPTTWDWTGTAPTGWTGTALGGTYTSAPFYLSAAVSGKYTAASQFFTIFFNSVPGVVTYNLYKNGTTTGYVFTVQESVDNITYTTLKSHTNALNALTNTTWVNFTATPLSTSRYIRFYYTTKDVNIAVDDISIGVPPTCPTLTGATQAAAVCAATAATINLTGLVASSTNNAIDYTINGVAQTQITGVNATVGGTASFTTPALAIGNNGQTLQITKITNGSCNTTFTQNVTLSVNAIPADPIGSISPAANPACVNTTLNYSAAAANFYWQTTAAGTNTLLPTTTDLTVSSNGTYYVRNYNGSCWSAGNVASAAITINTAPAAPVSSAASLITPTSFSANWAASATATTYYLDVCTDAGFTAFVTGYNNLNVGNVTTYSVTGLSSNVTYYYHVRASNACGTSANSGSQNTTTTKSATSDIISAGGTAVSIPSTENTVSPLTSATGVQVWQITVRDGGASSPDADGLPTILTAFTIAQVSNTVASWSQAIKTIELFDGATNVGIATVTGTQIQFTGLNISVADNTTKTLSLRLSLNCGVGSSNFDADRFGFSITSANTTFSAAGSSKNAFAAAQAGAAGVNVIDVVATQLWFVQQPTNTGTASTMTPSVTVAAEDACGNTDIGFSGTVSITSSGTMSVTPITATFTAGVATITPIIHTVAETGVVLTASCAGLTSTTSNSFEIYPYVSIPDNGCSTSTYATSIINYPTDYIITDVNVGVKIAHTFRGDLNISLVAPNGFTVLLIASVGSSADNLDGIIDDQAAANQFSIATNHIIDGVYDVNGKPEGTGTGLLSAFNGLSSLGNWTLKICDDAGADLGGVISWEIFITGTSPCAFSAGAITGAPFSVNCSSGATGSVAYSSSCTFTGNTFTAQLSNASGSFASPTTIGTSVSDVNTGSVNISIPAGITTSAGYLIRIISTSPVYTSSSSAAFTITNTVPCAITPGAITGAPFNVTCSTGASGTIAFTSSATYASNTYTVQLSDAAGSFTFPTNIGSLVSNANSGTINFTIPSGVPTGASYLIRIISNSPSVIGSSSASVSITLSGSPCQAFEIQSILVDACGNPEGGNEMVRFQVGGSALNTADINVSWPNVSNTWRGICQNATTASTVAAINASITAGGMLIEPTSGVLPANAKVMFFTSTSFNYSLYDFSTLNYTLYAIFQCSGNTAGHFVNNGSGVTNPTNRTLNMSFTGFGSDAVTYNAYNVYAGDGGAVDFTPPGVPTYGSTGGCKAPITPLPIELLSFIAKPIGKKIQLLWRTASELNNDYFTVERSADAVNFDQINITDGAGNSTQTIKYSVIDDSPLSGISYYRLKQTDFDGKYNYSNLVAIEIETNTDFQILNAFSSTENGLLDVTINCGNNCLLNFELYDMTGKKVFSSNENVMGNNRSVSIPTNHLSTGIYLLKVYNGEKMISKKLRL